MKLFISFLHKEFIHIGRDKVTLLILLVMPVLMVCLFGFAITTETKNSRVIIIDQQNDDESHAVINEIDANAYFNVTQVRADAANIDDCLKRGDAEAAIIISEGLGIQILADASEPNQAQTRAMYLQQIVMSVRGRVVQSRDGYANRSGGIIINSRMLYNPQLKSEYNFVPGVIGMIVILICAMMTSVSIVREKERGTMEILLASPMKPLVIILAKLIPYFIVSCINLATILLLSRYVLGVPIAGSVVTFCLVAVIYILVALSLGLLISTAVSTQLSAMLLSLLLIVPTMYLSGMAFPLESMPLPLQKVSCIIPTRWFNEAARRILIQGVEIRYVMKHIVILSVMAVVLISISFSLFKKRLE